MKSIDSIKKDSVTLLGDDRGSSAELSKRLQNWNIKLGFSNQLVAASE